MTKQSLFPILIALSAAATVFGCKPRADGFVKIQHPAINNSVEANEIDWNDGVPFGLSKKVFRNVASLTEMTPDQVCFEVILSGFDDESAADLAAAGFVLRVDDARYTPRIEQSVAPHMSEHKGKKTEFETVDTGLRENVCVEGVRNDRGEIVTCTRWQQNKITQTHAYDVPVMYNVVQGAGQACFDTKGQIKPEDVKWLLLEITNAKSERSSAFWGVRYQAMTRLRWDMIGDLPEPVPATWGGSGGTNLAGKAMDAAPLAEAAPDPEPVEEEFVVEKTGIPACDDYVGKMLTCADKLKDEGRDSMRTNAQTTAETYKKLSATKQGKAAAAQACASSAKLLPKTHPTCK